jgi:hypothetical protein
MNDRSMAISILVLALALSAPGQAFAQILDAQPVVIENGVGNPVPVLIPPDTQFCSNPDCPTTTRRESDLNPFQWTGSVIHLESPAAP